MKPTIKKWVTSSLLAVALTALVILTGCAVRTYNMVDPGHPSQTFMAFYRAVSDGDDDTANALLGNYAWHSYVPEKTGEGTYSVNGTELGGSDALLLECLMKSRRCEVVSESDYDKNDADAYVTIRYTSFDMKAFQQELAARSVEAVKEKRYEGQVFQTSSDTQGVIEQLKAELLKQTEAFYTTRTFRIRLIGVKGKWKVLLTEEFYKALSGYTD